MTYSSPIPLIRSVRFDRMLRVAAVLLIATALLQGCTRPAAAPQKPDLSAVPPLPRPDRSAEVQAELRRKRAEEARQANAAAEAAANTPASQNMRDYLRSIEGSLIARGKLRSDDGSALGPITPEQLTENFIQTVLRDEYTRQGDRLIAASQSAPLRRWEMPVRMQIEYGASISPAQRSRIGADIGRFAGRLQSATGHPVTITKAQGNFHIFILSEDERRQIGPRLNAVLPGIPATDVTALGNLAPQIYCTVFAYSRGNGASYVQAVALIRSELPPRLMLSCIHEELAQGMGPANDSPTVRPSIFNDDEEFALLTRHDELLLKILYDPRLRPGMQEAEARPIILQIARELLAPQSVEAATPPATAATAPATAGLPAAVPIITATTVEETAV